MGGVLDNVIVGDDVALFVPDEPGALPAAEEFTRPAVEIKGEGELASRSFLIDLDSHADVDDGRLNTVIDPAQHLLLGGDDDVGIHGGGVDNAGGAAGRRGRGEPSVLGRGGRSQQSTAGLARRCGGGRRPLAARREGESKKQH